MATESESGRVPKIEKELSDAFKSLAKRTRKSIYVYQVNERIESTIHPRMIPVDDFLIYSPMGYLYKSKKGLAG